jgi:ABC-type multidrug transport system fused ATPase/permease subunit
LKNPLILLLDEATSALDSHSESLLQQVLLTQGKTCLVVAHRLSTIRNANMILVMKHGEIIERGTHDELMELGKEYFELWTKQQKTDN